MSSVVYVVPKKKSKNRGLTESITVLVTEKLKQELEEMGAFENIDVPEWLREIISANLEMHKNAKKAG